MEANPIKSLYTLKKMLLKFIELDCQWKNFEKILIEYLKCYRQYRVNKRKNYLKTVIQDEQELKTKIEKLDDSGLDINDRVYFTFNEILSEVDVKQNIKEKIDLVLNNCLTNSEKFSDYNKNSYIKYKFNKLEN